MICSSATASQSKAKTEVEPIVLVDIKKVKSERSMLSFAYTAGPYGYRIHELLEQSECKVSYYTISPFLKSKAGKKRQMYNLDPCAGFKHQIQNLLYKAMSAAQAAACKKYDNAWSLWQYKNGIIEFKNSKPILKEWQSTVMSDNDFSENDSNPDEQDYKSENEDDED